LLVGEVFLAPINASFVRADEHFVPGRHSTDLSSPETGLWMSSGFDCRPQHVVDRLRQ
jgi:hypothetical protein